MRQRQPPEGSSVRAEHHSEDLKALKQHLSILSLRLRDQLNDDRKKLNSDLSKIQVPKQDNSIDEKGFSELDKVFGPAVTFKERSSAAYLKIEELSRKLGVKKGKFGLLDVREALQEIRELETQRTAFDLPPLNDKTVESIAQVEAFAKSGPVTAEPRVPEHLPGADLLSEDVFGTPEETVAARTDIHAPSSRVDPSVLYGVPFKRQPEPEVPAMPESEPREPVRTLAEMRQRLRERNLAERKYLFSRDEAAYFEAFAAAQTASATPHDFDAQTVALYRAEDLYDIALNLYLRSVHELRGEEAALQVRMEALKHRAAFETRILEERWTFLRGSRQAETPPLTHVVHEQRESASQPKEFDIGFMVLLAICAGLVATATIGKRSIEGLRGAGTTNAASSLPNETGSRTREGDTTYQGPDFISELENYVEAAPDNVVASPVQRSPAPSRQEEPPPTETPDTPQLEEPEEPFDPYEAARQLEHLPGEIDASLSTQDGAGGPETPEKTP